MGLDEEDAQFLDQLAINKKKREAEWRAEEQLVTKRFREQADKLSSSTGASSGLKKVPVPKMMHAKSTSQAKSTSSTLSNASTPQDGSKNSRNSHRKIVAGVLKKPKTNEPANDGKLEGKATLKEMNQSRGSQNDTAKDHSVECGTNVKEVPALKSILSAYGTSSSDEED